MNGVVIAETMRRSVTGIAYGSYVAFLALVAVGVSNFNQPGAAWPSLVTLLALVLGCAPIGPELSSGTLQLILTKPVNRSVYLVSRVAGVVCAVWIATFIGFCAEVIGRAIFVGDVPAGVLGSVLIHSMADTILICALLVFFGSLTRAYFNIAIYFVIMIGLNISQVVIGFLRASRGMAGEWLRSHDILDRIILVVEKNLFPDVPRQLDTGWMLMVLSNAAIAIVAACFVFRRREVPYGAD